MASKKMADIRLVLLDVDGVLTEGNIVYTDEGMEVKTFHVRDGLGIRLLMAAGIKVGIVTGRSSGALRHRCDNLGIAYVFDGVRDKGALVEQIRDKTGVESNQTAFIGDDLPDLPLMRAVGLPIAVADAHPEVLKAAEMKTERVGGKGAVREAAEEILKAQGKWESLMKRFF